jgi:hypothetical protein
MNTLPSVGALGAVGGLCAVVGGFWYWATPKFFEVGYMPIQPGGGFNHQLHAGKLGLDCRYCHTKIEKSPEANIPNVATCYGCHADGHVQLPDAQMERTKFIRDAYAADESIPWRRVHKLPDYVRNFPHNVHINAGVSCFLCHGQITSFPEVFQRQPLSMGWCLECHRSAPDAPETKLVPKEKVTDLYWVESHFKGDDKNAPPVAGFDARAVAKSLNLSPPTNCGACHY